MVSANWRCWEGSVVVNRGERGGGSRMCGKNQELILWYVVEVLLGHSCGMGAQEKHRKWEKCIRGSFVIVLLALAWYVAWNNQCQVNGGHVCRTFIQEVCTFASERMDAMMRREWTTLPSFLPLLPLPLSYSLPRPLLLLPSSFYGESWTWLYEHAKGKRKEWWWSIKT